jgi:hypothetical protein
MLAKASSIGQENSKTSGSAVPVTSIRLERSTDYCQFLFQGSGAVNSIFRTDPPAGGEKALAR